MDLSSGRQCVLLTALDAGQQWKAQAPAAPWFRTCCVADPGPSGVRVPNARALHSHFAFSDSPARRRLLYTAIWCLIKQDPLMREKEHAVSLDEMICKT